MNPSGLWRGKSQGRVGHFKFINVELLPDRNTLRQQRRSASEKLKVTEQPGPPQSVEDLLKRIGLEVRTYYKQLLIYINYFLYWHFHEKRCFCDLFSTFEWVWFFSELIPSILLCWKLKRVCFFNWRNVKFFLLFHHGWNQFKWLICDITYRIQICREIQFIAQENLLDMVWKYSKITTSTLFKIRAH